MEFLFLCTICVAGPVLVGILVSLFALLLFIRRVEQHNPASCYVKSALFAFIAFWITFGGYTGILVEILKDVSFRIVPLAKRDAAEMIREIKGYPLLEGYRNQEPVDIANLEDFILKVSNFVEQHPEIKELDLNPVFAYSDGAIAVDARVILEEA